MHLRVSSKINPDPSMKQLFLLNLPWGEVNSHCHVLFSGGFQVAKENFNDICIYPEKFREILLDKVGFRSAEVITNRLVGSVAGFDRPIEVYHK